MNDSTGNLSYSLLPRLTEFMFWGDRKMMVAAAAVAGPQYYAARDFSAGSLHKLLVHAMAAQWVWLSRWRGTSPLRLEDATDYPTREALGARWAVVHKEFAVFIQTQTAATFQAPLTYRNTQGGLVTLPLGELVMHCLDHATYHRGQVNSMIKLAGGTPATFNYYLFSLEHSAR